MNENDLKPVYFDMTKGIPEEINLPQVISEWLALTREAAIDLSAGSTCVATLQYSTKSLAVISSQRISPVHLRTLKEALVCAIPQHSQNLIPGQSLHVTINDDPEDRYAFEPGIGEFTEEIVLPLSLQNTPVGLMFVGSFCGGADSPGEKFLRRFENELSSTLRILWQFQRKQREKYEALVGAALEGLILCGKDKTIQFINRAAVHMLRLAENQSWVGKSLRDLETPFLTEFLEEALENGLHEINKVVHSPEDKSTLIGVHTELLKTRCNSEIGWVIILSDVTTNWQNDQLRSALTMASHEIKTPLSSIGGAIDLLLEKDIGDLSSSQEDCLNVIKDDIRRLNRLLGNILDLSRFDEGVEFVDRRREISLEFVASKVIYAFQGFARKKDIEIMNKVPKSIPTFKGDRDRLQQVLANLLENGLKYSYPGGKVELSATLKNSILNCSIKDYGVGIPAEHFEMIFGRFKQLDNYPDHGDRGYGLGLSIAKEIVEAAGGKIWVESEVGVGSTFYFTIPI